MILIDQKTDTLIGEVAIGSTIVPRQGEYITVSGCRYQVMDVVHRMNMVNYMTTPRVDLYVTRTKNIPHMLTIPQSDGIDKERWVKIGQDYDDAEAKQKEIDDATR